MKIIVCEGLPLWSETGETYGEYMWPVTPYFMASFPVTQAHTQTHSRYMCTRQKNRLNTFTTYSAVNTLYNTADEYSTQSKHIYMC